MHGFAPATELVLHNAETELLVLRHAATEPVLHNAETEPVLRSLRESTQTKRAER